MQKRKLGFFLFFFGVGFYILFFKIRPFLIGETHPHGEGLLEGLLSHPWSTFYNAAKIPQYTTLFKIYAPFIIPLGFALEAIPRKSRLTSILPLLSFLAPMVLVHFLANKVSLHYGAQMVGPVIGYLIGSQFFDALLEHKKIFILQIILAIGVGISHYSKPIKYYFFNKDKQCYTRRDKLPKLKELEDAFKKVPAKTSILATGGIIPRLMNMRHDFYHLEGFSKRQESYDYIIIERNRAGNTWHLYDQKKIEDIILRCEEMATNVLVKNRFYFFAKGPFNYLCKE